MSTTDAVVSGVVVLGAGTVGRALLGQIAAHRAALTNRRGIRLEVLAVATSRFWAPADPGHPLDDQALAAIAGGGITAVQHQPYADAGLRRLLGARQQPA